MAVVAGDSPFEASPALAAAGNSPFEAFPALAAAGNQALPIRGRSQQLTDRTKT